MLKELTDKQKPKIIASMQGSTQIDLYPMGWISFSFLEGKRKSNNQPDKREISLIPNQEIQLISNLINPGSCVLNSALQTKYSSWYKDI